MNAVEVPEIGESITEGILVTWLKEDGDHVEEQEELFELETDKATLAVPSPASGTLKIMVKEGSDVKVGDVVAQIEPEKPGTSRTMGAEVDFQIKLEEDTKTEKPPEPAKMTQAPDTAAVAETRKTPPLSPAIRRLVHQYGLDPAAITGTGKDGRLTKKDIIAYMEQKQQRTEPPKEIVLDIGEKERTPETAAEQPRETAKGPEQMKRESTTEGEPLSPGTVRSEIKAGRERRVPMTSIRKRMAENLLKAKQSAAHVTTINEIDMTQVIELRNRYRESFAERYAIRLGFMSFFVKACCAALSAYPVINARLEGDDIVYHDYYNIGVAVSTDRGLIVPVIKNADMLSFAEIEQQIRGFISRAGEKKLTISELTGGTFSITNGGVFGSLLSTPIPNPPQVAILGMHAINDRPVAENGEVVIRPMMYVSLTYDHRIIEGREAVRFLVRVRECIEDPSRILLDI